MTYPIRTTSPAKPDPRPTRRIRLKPAVYLQRTRALLRSTRRCECGCGRPCHSIHHVIGGNGKEDVPANWMCLNGDGVRGCHGAFTSKNRVWDDQRGEWIEPLDVAAGLRRTMETRRLDVLEYVLVKKGRDWLDKRYPEKDIRPPV